MDLSRAQYDDLVKFANSLTKGREDIMGEDVVGDCILEYLLENTYPDYFKIRQIVARKSKTQKNRPSKTFNSKETTKVCSKCKEEKPMGLFYFCTRLGEAGKPHSYCKECFKKWSFDHYVLTKDKKVYDRDARKKRWDNEKRDRKLVKQKKEYHENWRQIETSKQKMRDAAKRYYYKNK